MQQLFYHNNFKIFFQLTNGDILRIFKEKHSPMNVGLVRESMETPI
jgi:hypothetical protein